MCVHGRYVHGDVHASEKLRRLIKLDLTHFGNDMESCMPKDYLSNLNAMEERDCELKLKFFRIER